MKMFLATKENIPEGLGFSTFDLTHILWLLATVTFWVLSVIFYKKADRDKRKKALKILGIVIVLFELSKVVLMLCIGEFMLDFLPFHLCGINILLIAFDLIKETKVVRHFIYYFSIPGALLALLFPNWTMLPCLNFSHIHSFVMHAFLLLYPVLLVVDGEVEPKFSGMLKSLALLLVMVIPIYFINLWLGTNFMFLISPETGNPLGLFEAYLGNHLWGFPILLPLVMAVMYLPLKIAQSLNLRRKIK